MDLPVISAIKNISDQTTLDQRRFSDPSDFETAKYALFASNLIKTLGVLFLIGTTSFIFKVDSKTPLLASEVASKCLQVCSAILLSMEALVIGDNIFHLYCKMPAKHAIALHESGVEELAQTPFKDMSFGLLSSVASKTLEIASSNVLTPEEFRNKQFLFIFRNTIGLKVGALYSAFFNPF